MTSDTSPALFHGSCLCGQVQYQLRSAIKAVSHCHCSMCRKAHGAAFGSYGSVPLDDYVITHGAELISGRDSSPGVERTFCSGCGSPLTWRRKQGEMSGWISVALGTLDTPFTPPKYRHVDAASAPDWHPTDLVLPE